MRVPDCENCGCPVDNEGLRRAVNAHEELVEALTLVRDWYGIGMSPPERYESLGEWFYRETGSMRPGKDAPPGLNCGSPSERAEAFGEWVRVTEKRVIESVRAALKKASGG